MVTSTKRDFMQGPLYRAAAIVYAFLVATVCFLLACFPFIAAVFITNAPVVLTATGFSIGPAWVAIIYVMRAFSQSHDIEPARLFWRGYRMGCSQALLFWVPYLSLLTILGFDVFALPNMPVAARWLIMAMGAVAVLWGNTVLLIIATFSFRLRDVLRLAIYSLLRSPRWFVANAALLLVTGAAIYGWSEVAAGLLAAPIALNVVINSRKLRERLRVEFTSGARSSQ